jgi:acyl transferase domain-containing protein
VNHDGKSNGFTAPSRASQEEVIVAALQKAKLEPSQIGYLEAHGTGTPIGDNIEMQASGAVLGRGRSRDLPLLIGSVKTNILMNLIDNGFIFFIYSFF